MTLNISAQRFEWEPSLLVVDMSCFKEIVAFHERLLHCMISTAECEISYLKIKLDGPLCDIKNVEKHFGEFAFWLKIITVVLIVQRRELLRHPLVLVLCFYLLNTEYLYYPLVKKWPYCIKKCWYQIFLWHHNWKISKRVLTLLFT